ncbi:tobamovirus multiplication protein 1-like isoform x1 [Anaeramoeba flamelloides]|uniref:Tobamovirus multiplication protein 1-like isoform x1 n=1 Tax=Anaeramoeba flamelloides TaxID=1746091 RepID=A0AAV7Y1Z7_9EUKA|nr:tobamovirus multiplication protein 1-like isoform x1 [Anaeramoeba flamelloides]KAJ6234616.1 tobamovirus multiplication protein 1-like isoform x1 [Anaeramoeba flamelloides]
MSFQLKGILNDTREKIIKRLKWGFIIFDALIFFIIIMLAAYTNVDAVTLFEAGLFLLCGCGLLFYGYKIIKLTPNSNSRIAHSTKKLFKVIVSCTIIYLLRIPAILIYSLSLYKRMTEAQATIYVLLFFIIAEIVPVLLIILFVFQIPRKNYQHLVDSNGSDPIIYD